MLVTILVFLLVLSVLVFVHELGHFTVARMHGIKVEEFGFFGFPPRVFGVVWDERAKRRRIIWGHRDEQVAREMTPAESSVAGAVLSESPVAPASFKHTIYSLNWIPFGGFVRIKGEDGSGQSDPDSFAAKPAWPRIQVLAAGVVMNFLFAWILLSIVLMLGFPQQASDTSDPTVAGQAAEIQIQQVLPGTPAETMGLRMGDVILSVDALEMRTLGQVQTYIQEHKGQEVTFKVDRGGKVLALRGMPRTDYPAREGSLGIVFTSVVTVQYPVGTALVEGAKQTAHLTVAMTEGLGRMLTGGGKLSDVSGPVGIAQYTRQASDLGLAYLLFFAAVLSINLAIINILPFPALDGGRILFVLIETVRGRPVSARVEGWVNQIGFLFLIGLMLLVTAHDIFRALRP